MNVPRAQPSSEPAPHDGKAMGRAAHGVIGRLLAAGIDEPTPEQILAFAAQEPLLHERHVYRLAARQRLIAATAIYWRRFFPARATWTFLDFGVPVQGSDLDLVFEHRGTDICSDELKTGGAPALAETEALGGQLERQLAGGREKYGDRYIGARVLFFGAPARSFFVSIDGARAPLSDGGKNE